MPVTLGPCEVLYVLFFLIFYSLFVPCPACPFIFSYLLLFILHLPCPPFYFSLFFTLYLAPALPALLFFLIFYSLFGPCPARLFIFPYLLLFIWPLSFPHGPAPCPALQDRRTDGPCPAPPCPVWPPVFPNPGTRFPNPVFRIRLSGPVPPRQLRRGTVVVQTDFTTSIKTWNRRRTDRRTDGQTPS